MSHQIKILFGWTILILTIQSCTDLDDNLKVGIPKEIISRKYELIELIGNVVDEDENPSENIVCIDFIYPVKLFAYDANLEHENDWFILFVTELHGAYNNLASIDLGNFENANYWSSTQESVSKAKCINFLTGEKIDLDKNTGFVKTRVIRYF